MTSLEKRATDAALYILIELPVVGMAHFHTSYWRRSFECP